MNFILSKNPIRNHLFFFFGIVFFFCGCQEKKTDFLKNSGAKLYCFTHEPYFNQTGYSVYVLTDNSISNSLENFSYSVKQLSEDPDCTLMTDSTIAIDGKVQQFNQCGTYHIVVNHYGEVTDIPDFQYRGEQQIQVARGVGWSLIISREDWTDKQ